MIPKFKAGDVITNISSGRLVATVTNINHLHYKLMFSYTTHVQIGTIAIIDKDYMLQSIRNSPLNQELK